MKAKEEEDQKEQDKLMARVKQLEHNLEDCTEKLLYWQGKYSEIEDAYGRERQLRQSAETEVDVLRKGATTGMEAVALPSRRPVQNEYMVESASGIPDGTTATELSDLGCGKCSAETRCQCIDEAFNIDNEPAEPNAPTFKRPHSPQSQTDNKRHRLSNPYTSSEIDFTTQFSTRRPPTLASSASTSSSVAAIAPLDPCGFCSDGTTCLCAELAKERPVRALKPPESTLPTPPESAITNMSTSNPCGNTPGSCNQCRSNPTSTLFCKTLAATRPIDLNPLSSISKTSTNKETNQGSALNCADAFTVLSRHPGFDQATSELTTWIPKLSTVPSVTTAFDIEAASVMSVLKHFDRRFGNTGKCTPKNAKETSIDQLDRFPVQISQEGLGDDTSDKAGQTEDARRGNEFAKQETKDGIWIAYAPGSQAKGKPGRPRADDGREPKELQMERHS